MSNTLVGLAVGDALGAPFETQHFTSTALAGWSGQYLGSQYHGTRPGEGTDDTLMTLALAEVLAVNKDYDPEKAGAKYVEAFFANPGRGWGKATQAALERLRNGSSWVASGSPSEGNGSAMRAAPFGLRYEFKDAIVWAMVDAVITHDRPEAKEGSAAIAGAISLLRANVSPLEVVSRLAEELNPSMIRRKIRNLLSQKWESTLQVCLAMGTGAHVIETVPAALGTLLTAKGFEDAVKDVILAGGDTDTTAAIVGALWGTFSPIPERWLTGLNPAVRSQAERLQVALTSDHL